MKCLRKVKNILLILGIIHICLSIQISYVNAETNNKIKVGYSIVPGFTEVNDGIYSGFSFEYLREISKYTGWEYEFIQMSLNDVINKLKDGEIDIAGGMFKNEQTMELYDFPEYSTGATYTTLVTLKDNNSIDISNIETLDGIKVGYFETAKVKLEKFNEFCKASGIENVNLIPYPYGDDTEIKEALKSGEIDAIITGDLLNNDEEKVIARFGAVPYYFATTKGNTEIISDLNKAIFKIKEKNPDYEQILYNKYFEIFNSKIVSLNKEEKEYINSLGVLKAIYVDNNIPVQYYNTKTNEADGIFIDLVRLIMERAGIKVEFIEAYTYEEAYKMIEDKKADLIVAVPDTYLIENGKELFITQSYMNTDIVRVKNKNIKLDKEITAVVKGYGYPELIDEGEIKYYENLEEALKAIEKGEATITSYNNYSVSNYISTNYYSNLVVLYREDNVGASIGFAKPIDKELINIINKSINTLSKDEISSIIYENTSNIHHKVTVKQIIIENTALLIVIGVIIIIAISMIILRRVRKLNEDKKLLLKKSQIDVLTGAYNREAGETLIKEYLNTKSLNLYYAFIIIDIDYFKKVNDRLGHHIGDDVLKEFTLILMKKFTKENIICRLGGDEFIVFVKDIQENNINMITQKLNVLCTKMKKNIEYNNIKQEISLSIGCVISNKNSDFKELYKQADEMLYKVKNNGKNGYEIKNYN